MTKEHNSHRSLKDLWKSWKSVSPLDITPKPMDKLNGLIRKLADSCGHFVLTIKRIDLISFPGQNMDETHRHLATLLTLFQCIFGCQLPLCPWNAVDEWFKQGEEGWETTHQCLEQVAQNNKEFANRFLNISLEIVSGSPAGI